MKKTLTENISRYDDKMRLRLDKKTALAFLFAALPAALVGWLLNFIFSIMMWMPIIVTLFLALVMLQIGVKDGMPLYKFFIEIMRQSQRTKIKYVYTSEDRVSIRSSTAEEGGNPHGKKQKRK